MNFAQPLIRATLLRRYKRFLADIRLPDGAQVTAHCPNPGAMTGLADPGMAVWVEPNDDPKKKLKYGWRLCELPDGHFACIDTGIANRVVGAALRARAIPALARYDDIRPEVPYGDRSRVDFLARAPGQPDCYIEVKSVTLARRPGLAEFPDTKTARGARHMADLAGVAARGHRAVLVYVIQRSDCTGFAIAADIDPAYAAAADAAHAAGVETLVLRPRIAPGGLGLSGTL